MNAPIRHPAAALPPHAAVPARAGQDAYRKLDVGGRARSRRCMGRDMLVVEREALRALSEAAFNDINHLLRPAHLKQLRKILDDPEASANDKFVAYDFLKNANIAAGGVLPMCQDTGTAIIMGKKGRAVFTDGRRRGGARARARATPTSSAICAIRSSRRSRCSRRRTPSRTCRRRSRSTPRARTPTSFCSSPKAAARPTRRFCSRRRPRS